MNKKILILYAAIGEGHKSIADNIGFYLEQAGYKVELYDVQKIQGGWLVDWGKQLYQFLIGKMPFVWNWFYNTRWFITLTLPFRKSIGAGNYQKTLNIIKDLNPDAVICTHTTASGIVEYLKQKNLYAGKFGIAFSDFHLHRYWLYSRADFYLANTEKQKQEMMKLGILAEKVFVCGMALRPKLDVNLALVREKLEVKPHQKVVLISSGSQGIGLSQSLVAKFAQYPELKVIAVCGKNKAAFESLNNKFSGSYNTAILGYYSPMDELYAIADIFITKPGGLSVSEALRWHLPIAVSYLLPGGERQNYEYLLKKFLVLPESLDIESQVLAELHSSAFNKSLAKNPWAEKLLGNVQVIGQALGEILG